MTKSILFILTLFTIGLQSQNKVESALGERFNGTIWINDTGLNYLYDGSNNLSSQTEYLWANGAWAQDYKTTYTYNGANKATQKLGTVWNGSQFVNYYRTDYTYNGAGLLIKMVEQEWNQTQWENVYQTNLTYTNNLPSVGISSTWDGSQWVNETRSTLNYTGGLTTGSVSEDWDGSQWELSSRNTYTYNGNNKRTASIYENWDGAVWLEDFRTTYLVDNTGNRLSETDVYLGITQSRIDYNYDLLAQFSNFTHPFKDKTGTDYFFEDFPYVNKILTGYNYIYNTNTSSFELSTRTTLNYNNSLSSASHSEINSIKLYPNPSTDYIQLSGLTNAEKITIYSVLGTKIFENTIYSDDQINIQNLSNGFYILKFENGNTLKFLKK